MVPDGNPVLKTLENSKLPIMLTSTLSPFSFFTMKDRELYVLVKYAVRQTGCFPFTWQNWIIPVGKSNGFGIQFGKQVSKYGL